MTLLNSTSDKLWFVSPSYEVMAGGFRFAIDRGGTFTDVYSECPNGEVKVMKLLSVDPAYPDAPREGIRRILQEVKTVLLVLNFDGRSSALVFSSYVTYSYHIVVVMKTEAVK